jgi:excisionase family DNA binding protein
MPPATSQDGATAYTLHESAQLLGVSLGTIRRRIARGELRAERVHRPQGHVWQVWLEPAQDAVDPPIQPPASNLPQHPGEMQRAETMSVFLVPLLQQAMQPLVDELAATRAQLVSDRRSARSMPSQRTYGPAEGCGRDGGRPTAATGSAPSAAARALERPR